MTERWQDDAACRGEPVAVFFPVDGASVRPALVICLRCPVRDTCRDEHLDEPYGVWGGTTEDERAFLRRGTGRRVRGLLAACAWCADPFVADSVRHRFCSHACRRQAQWARLKSKREEGEVA